jgi:Acyl-CoA oxidase
VWSGTLTLAQVRLAKAATAELLDRIRPNAVALIDAFDLPDRFDFTFETLLHEYANRYNIYARETNTQI